MKWTVKSAAFRTLARVPYGSEIHYLAQRKLTKEWPRPRQHIEAYWERGKAILNYFREFSARQLTDCRFVEIGAGRDLALAAALRASGVGSITCIDIERLAKIDLIQHAAEILGWRAVFNSWPELKSLGIDYKAPENAERTTLADRSVDCFYTSEVFEHIPATSLSLILADAHRYLRDDGLLIHAIDYSDHFARSDRSISRFNFLKFSDSEWKQHNSRFQYVNRLRHSDYVKMTSDAGFTVLKEDIHYEDVPPDVLNQLAGRFRNCSMDDLRALRSIVVASK